MERATHTHKHKNTSSGEWVRIMCAMIDSGDAQRQLNTKTTDSQTHKYAFELTVYCNCNSLANKYVCAKCIQLINQMHNLACCLLQASSFKQTFTRYVCVNPLFSDLRMATARTKCHSTASKFYTKRMRPHGTWNAQQKIFSALILVVHLILRNSQCDSLFTNSIGERSSHSTTENILTLIHR